MHLATKGLGLGWVAIGGLLGAASAGIPLAKAPSAALLNYGSGGFVSPVSILGIVTVLWVVIDWQLARTRRARVNKAILKDKPGLAKDPKGLRRERRIREKEFKLQKSELKALRAEDRAEKKIAKSGRKENTLERKREHIAVKKDRLRERQNLGR